MGDMSVEWEVEGVISTKQSVSAMLKVVATTMTRDTGKFLTWEGKVSGLEMTLNLLVMLNGTA